jgi:MoxR-like ATPase
MRPSDCAAILEREVRAAASGEHTPVMLWGPPGVGKSQLVAATAAKLGIAVVDIRLAQMEPTDLRGIPFRTGEAVTWAPPALLPRAERDGARGILFLDEITSAVPTVTAAAYQLILDRRLGEYRVPEGWAILAAGNRHGDRGVTYQMPAPLANRFTHYEVDPDLDDWVRWAHGQSVDARLVAFLRFRPDLLFAFDPARQGAAFPSPRSWAFADRALRKFADAPALLAESLKACVGAAAGLAFRAYLQHVDKLPDPADVIAGKVARPPDPVELQYALAASIVHHVARLPRPAQDAALEAALGFARAFPAREIGVMLVTDLARVVDRPLYDVPAFAAWAGTVNDLLGYERGAS